MNTYTVYQHTQRGTVTLVAVGLAPLVLLGVVFFVPGVPRLPLLPVLVVLGVSAVLFSSLTIRVDARRLTWWFGPGAIRKSVLLSDVASVEPVRTTFWQGWGIHLTRNGWLYNVAGYDAVRVQLRNGKTFMLGTDDVTGVCAAVNTAIGIR